jgi:hypothetical protein
VPCRRRYMGYRAEYCRRRRCATLCRGAHSDRAPMQISDDRRVGCMLVRPISTVGVNVSARTARPSPAGQAPPRHHAHR